MTTETNPKGVPVQQQGQQPGSQSTPMGRPGQPQELVPAYVFLASNSDSSYISGQVIHVNGGQVVGS